LLWVKSNGPKGGNETGRERERSWERASLAVPLPEGGEVIALL